MSDPKQTKPYMWCSSCYWWPRWHFWLYSLWEQKYFKQKQAKL